MCCDVSADAEARGQLLRQPGVGDGRIQHHHPRRAAQLRAHGRRWQQGEQMYAIISAATSSTAVMSLAGSGSVVSRESSMTCLSEFPEPVRYHVVLAAGKHLCLPVGEKRGRGGRRGRSKAGV